MADYRDTVHVPVTSFPMRGDLLHRQEEMLARWQAQDLYRAILEDRRDAQPFIRAESARCSMRIPEVTARDVLSEALAVDCSAVKALCSSHEY